MKTIISYFIITFTFFVQVYSQTQSEFTVPLSDPTKQGKLIAGLHSGSVTVKGTARKDILIRYKSEDENDKGKSKSKSGSWNIDVNVNLDRDHDKSKDKSKEGLRKVTGGNIDLSATENENTVKISSAHMHSDMHLDIEVPVTMDLKLSTHNDGDLTVSNISGAIELTNHNGAIIATGIKGSVIANTFNDDIKISFDDIKAGVPMSFSTYNGDIDVTLPTTTKATMKFKTDQGDIYTGFDMDIKNSGPVKKEDSKNGVYKVVVNDWKRGDLNGGGPEYTYKTYNGDIYVRKK